MLGLAIYNGVLLDFPLPLALYRKILGQEVKLRDLEDMQPTLGRCAGVQRCAIPVRRACGLRQPLINRLQRVEQEGVPQVQGRMVPPAARSPLTHCYLRCTGPAAPSARRSLRQLLQYEGPGSVEDVFCQSFTVEVPGFGDMRVVPLKEGGADVPVTGGCGSARRRAGGRRAEKPAPHRAPL